jgi:DNA repair protein RadC
VLPSLFLSVIDGGDGGRDCFECLQCRTRFSPSRPCARRCAPCSASRAAPEPMTAALPRALRAATGNPARDAERVMKGETLYVRDAQGGFTIASGEKILAAAKTHLGRRIHRGVAFTSPRLVRDYVSVNLGARECEYFCLALLDARHRLLDFVELFRGTIDGASVHPREVVKLVLARNAAAIVMVHNHPSQIAEPSTADETITRRLREALALIDVCVLDHLIVAGSDVVSFVERGIL